MSTDYIRSPQTITIEFDTVATNVIMGGSLLYLLLPGAYGEWISRGQTLDHATDVCSLEANNNLGTNILSECKFISKRVLKMTIGTTTNTDLHTLTLQDIYSPSKLPEGRNNQYRFKLFMSST